MPPALLSDRVRRSPSLAWVAASAACVLAAVVLSAACGKDHDDGDLFAFVDQIRGCDDVPRDGFGDKVEAETLVCGDRVMESGQDPCCGPFTQLGDMVIRSRQELTAILEQMSSSSAWNPETEPCAIDFDASAVLAAGTSIATCGCGDIEICGVYETADRITALVFFEDCAGPMMTPTDPYHFVRIPATTKPVEFEYYVYQHPWGP